MQIVALDRSFYKLHRQDIAELSDGPRSRGESPHPAPAVSPGASDAPPLCSPIAQERSHMADFEVACRKRGIELFVLPPRSPKLNGSVERIQETWTPA